LEALEALLLMAVVLMAVLALVPESAFVLL
jgi:hypothetical protein